MAVRAKFLNDFSEICSQFPEHYSIYSVHDVKNSFGITYSELDRLSDELSRYFVKIIGTGTQYVGIEAYDNFLIPSLILGIWKSGYSFVGIGTQYALKDTVNCLNALGVQYVIVDKNYTRCIENNAEIISSFQIHQQKLYLWRRKIQTKEKYKEDWDMCYGVMTSGTTGLLKIIQVPWSCILLNIEELMEEFQVNENDCILLASPFTFDPFFVELFLSLLSGCSLLTVPNTIKLCSTVLLHILFDTDNIGNEVLENPPHKNHQMDNNFCLNVERVRRKPITILQMTPSMFKNWTDDVIKNIILSSNTLLRILILGGESFPTEILKLRCKNNKTRIFNIYGITEISCWSFCYEITDEFSESQVPLGKALKNIIYKINSSDELIIGSSTRVCLINDEMKFKSGELRFRSTGDIVQLTNGKLYFVSRTNQIIKKFGIKINLEKIEKLFLNSNKSFKACFCVYDKFNMKLGLFYCVPNGNLTEHIKIISFENFIKLGYHYPNSELKDIEKPDYLIEISKVPLNSHGKCDKNELLKHLTNIHCDSKLCLEVENRFKCIWKNVLGLTDSDETSKSFTELGGNSILALQLINKLEDDGIAVQPNFIIKLLNGDSKESCFKSLSNFLLTGTPAKKRKLPEEVIKDDSIELKLKWKFDFGKCIDSTPTVFTADG